MGTPRGAGLLVGVTIKGPYQAQLIATAAREEGLLIGTAGGNSLRFAPPLIVLEDQTRRAESMLSSAISKAMWQSKSP